MTTQPRGALNPDFIANLRLAVSAWEREGQRRYTGADGKFHLELGPNHWKAHALDEEIDKLEALLSAGAEGDGVAWQVSHQTARTPPNEWTPWEACPKWEYDSIVQNRPRYTRARELYTRPAPSAGVGQTPASAAGESLYSELLLAVHSKHPNESRHETALRYIREREAASSVDSGAKLAAQGGSDG